MLLPERESRLPQILGRPVRFARRAVAYALKHEFHGQMEEMRALILESNAYTSRRLQDLESSLGRRDGDLDGRLEADLLTPRSLAVAYALRSLCTLGDEARILDLTPKTSALGFALASLGYRVTAVAEDPIGYGHPNLKVVAPGSKEMADDGAFDGLFAILPSTPSAGVRGRGLAAPAARLVLATLTSRLPVRAPAGWQVEESKIAQPDAEGRWTVVSRRDAARPFMSLVTARPR
jgi:hypothetical protein